ncbi:hypothetical protein ACHHYP_08002 [Achlya hypogyna]|uniref:Transmembrane protein n=1 Tax=Achlya hypogyna TaxID=1202772 RepID=A0A1V9YQD0_ACHHY|nr:hypothetical protein ACHHYP_08002 [Achlya hypogyna]
MSLLDATADFVEHCAASRRRIVALAAANFLATIAVNAVGLAFVDSVSIADPPLLPDVRFGYTPLELHDAYVAMGPTARRNYLAFELVDILTYIPSYVLFISALLHAAYAKLGAVSLLTYLPFFTGLCDVLENLAQMYTALDFADRASLGNMNWLLAAYTGTVANQFKWIALVVSLIVLLVTGVRALVAKPPSHTKTA